MSEVRERKVGIRWLKVIMVAGLIVQIVPVLWLESSRAAGTEQMAGVIQGRTLTSMPLPSQSDPAGALYYSIGPSDCSPDNAYGQITPFIRDWRYLKLLPMGSETLVRDFGFTAPLHLPQGAVIWGWRAWVVDNLAMGQIRRLAVYYGKHGENTAVNVGFPQETSIPSAETTVKILHQENLNHVVNNRDYSYSLYFVIRGINVEFRGAVIIYTMAASKP